MTARITALRRSFLSASAASGATETDRDPPQTLEARIKDLENLVQGLQDSVHREAKRQDKRITDLEARVEPSALAVALSKDARERGL
jgi:hypothetical protein